MESIKMVEVTRGGEIESFHQGVAILINSSGEILKEWGSSEKLIYPRSALKPIQSLNLYKDGIAEGLNISDKYIALTTASHHSESFHQKMLIEWLWLCDSASGVSAIFIPVVSCSSHGIKASPSTFLQASSNFAGFSSFGIFPLRDCSAASMIIRDHRVYRLSNQWSSR